MDMESATMFLSPRQAADWLGLSTRTLERYRGTGEGPVFYRFGRHVRYLQADLDAWAKTRRRTSTRDEADVCRAAARRHARRWPRRATVDLRGRRGPRRATHGRLGPRDVQPGRARRKRRPGARKTDGSRGWRRRARLGRESNVEAFVGPRTRTRAVRSTARACEADWRVSESGRHCPAMGACRDLRFRLEFSKWQRVSAVRPLALNR